MKVIFFNFLFLFGFLIISRIIPHPPNFTPILATAILAPQIFTKKLYLSIFLIILAMFISDLFIGIHKYIIFTYIPLILIIIMSNSFDKVKTSILVMAISSPLIFFLISNFGVWALSNFYAKDLNGLMQSYILALPFLKNTFTSTIFFIVLYFIIYNFLIFAISKFNPKILKYNNNLIFFKS